MEDSKTKTAQNPETAENTASETSNPDAPARDLEAEINKLTDKWKRALAEVENARKRANAARQDGREHGVATTVEALAPTYDAVCLAIRAAHADPEADTPRIKAYLEGLNTIKAAFENGLKALGVNTIAPEGAPFDPERHEAMQIEETDKAKPGEVLVLHRAGFALGQRMIRPAHVTVSAAPSSGSDASKE